MPKCLYCLQTDKKFTSEEHSVPFGLGNDDIKLPKGVVCDVCNNGILSTLDTVLLEYSPIKYLRAMHTVKSRSGKYTTFKTPGFHIIPDSDEHINITMLDKSKSITDMNDNGFTLNMRSNKKLTTKYTRLLARSLYKMALGLIYLDLGEDVAYSKRFDEVREIILGDIKEFHGQIFMTKKTSDLKSTELTHWDRVNEKGTLSFFVFKYYGIEISYEIEQRILEFPDEKIKDYATIIDF